MSKGRFVVVAVGLLCLLVLPSTASAMKFAPPSVGAWLGDESEKGVTVASGDFNGDGRDDIAVGSQDFGIQIRLASANGWVIKPTLLPNSGGAYSLAAGDFNEDGFADLVVSLYSCSGDKPSCNNGFYDPGVLLSNGDGTFSVPVSINSNLNGPAGWNAMTVGDADSDGNLDVIVGMTMGEYGIAYGNGSGSFTPAQRTQIPGAPHGFDDKAISTAVGDFNGDGDNDLAFALRNTGDVSKSAIYLLLGNGARSFTASSGNPFSIGPPTGFIDSIKSADFDHDGNDDLAASISDNPNSPASSQNGSIRVWDGDDEEDMVANPMATIEVKSPDPQTERGPSNLRVADFDNDGRTDLGWFEWVQPNGPWEYRLSVARNMGSTFSVQNGGSWDFQNATGNPVGLAIGDFNGDDAPDAAITAYGGGSAGGMFFLENKIDLSVSAEAFDFGELVKGSGNTSRTVGILNTGGPSAQIDQVTINGPDAADFSLISGCSDMVINALTSCLQRVDFNPNGDPGQYAANVHITFEDTSTTFDLPVTASIVVPRASFDPGHLDFGQLRNGQSRTLTSTVTNTGEAPLIFMNGGSIDGTNAARFQLMGDTCSGNTIAPDATCSVQVKATSNATGPVGNAEVRLINDGYESAEAVTLSYTGINPGYSTVPSSSDFGSVAMGDSETQFFNIESTGTTGLEITDLEVESTNAGDFAISGPGCLGVYQPNDDCQFQVVFQPQPGGGTSRTGQIQFQTNAQDAATVIPISGTATQPEVEITEEEYDFGDVSVGDLAYKTFTVTSTGDAPFEIEEAWVDGPNPEDNSDFLLRADGCSGATLAVGETCTYRIQFGPTEAREYLAYSGVYGSSGWDEVEMTGTGISAEPVGSFDPATHDFGEAAVNASVGLPSHTFTLKSSGNFPLDVTSLVIMGPDEISFGLGDQGACVTELESGQSCQIQVTFSPKGGSPGVRSAQLRANTNAGTIVASLTGTATAAAEPPATAKVTIKAPKKVKVKKKTKIKVGVTVTNTGTSPLTGAKVAYTARQGKKGKAKDSKRVSLPTVPAGESIRKNITINLRAAQLDKKKLAIKLNFNVVHEGKTLASKTGTTRLDFGQAKIRRPKDVSSS